MYRKIKQVKVFKVGGCIRDTLMGVKSNDIDYVVEANSYEEMKQHIIDSNCKIYKEFPQYFTIRAKSIVGEDVDYTLCRKDGYYSDNRRPDEVRIGTLEEDLSRRDFTMNAIAFEITNSSSLKIDKYSIIDPFGGYKDIKNKIIRCVGDTEERFNEDPLRVIRALRFSILKDFNLSREILNYLKRPFFLLSRLQTISSERIVVELNKCFTFDTYRTLQVFFRKEYRDLDRIMKRLLEDKKIDLGAIYLPDKK